MDDTELFVCIVAVLVAGFSWIYWYWRAARIFAPGSSSALRSVLLAAPTLLVGIFPIILHRVGPADIRNSPGYLLLFSAVSAASLCSGTLIASALGLDPLADGLETGNAGVVMAVVGFWLALTMLNVGSNIGQGASISTTLIPLLLSVIELGAFAIALAWITRLAERTTCSRSKIAGARFGAFMFFASLPLAHAASGDWVSLSATAVDLAATIPVLAGLAAAAGLLEKYWPSR